MRESLFAAAIAVFALSPLAGAGAVDIVNEDESPYLLVIDTGEAAKEIEIGGGQTLTGACESCVVQLGEDGMAEAEGDQIVKIKGGKLSVGG